MKMKNVIAVILMLVTSTTLPAQDTTGVTRKTTNQNQSGNVPKQQINQLHDGVLLVRLATRKNAIDALRKNGNDAQANQIENRQAEINKQIISAFRSNFDFCRIYFFYSDYSKEVMEKRFDHVKFLNDSLTPDPTITFDGKNFLTAEFASVEQDTSKYFDNYRTVSEETGPEKQSAYYGGSELGFEALIIKSDVFIQLRRPFPYYVKANGAPEDKKKTNNVIRKMNKKLHDFYKQMNS